MTDRETNSERLLTDWIFTNNLRLSSLQNVWRIKNLEIIPFFSNIRNLRHHRLSILLLILLFEFHREIGQLNALILIYVGDRILPSNVHAFK